MFVRLRRQVELNRQQTRRSRVTSRPAVLVPDAVERESDRLALIRQALGA